MKYQTKERKPSRTPNSVSGSVRLARAPQLFQKFPAYIKPSPIAAQAWLFWQPRMISFEMLNRETFHSCVTSDRPHCLPSLSSGLEPPHAPHEQHKLCRKQWLRGRIALVVSSGWLEQRKCSSLTQSRWFQHRGPCAHHPGSIEQGGI